MSYYGEFRSEVDADAVWANRVERQEREHWEREQAVTA
jgi:hypothetical protein